MTTESATDEFLRKLLAVAHPVDNPFPEAWKPYYCRMFELSLRLRPKTICEIGVRAGYSAFAMLSANPESRLLGIEADEDERSHNTHGGRQGLYKHALEILADFDFELLIVNSHAVRRLPAVDLVYVDGDHSYEGCLRDLALAEKSTNRILVDDYDSIPDVRRAVDEFLGSRPEFQSEYVDNSLTGFMVMTRTR